MNKKNLMLAAPFIVVILGMIGFMGGEGYGFYEAFLASLKLLKVHLDPLPAGNITLELARWTGVVFFFSLIYTAITAVISNSVAFIKSRNNNTVAIHGDSPYAGILNSALKKRALLSESKQAFKASKQVILFSNDKDALDYYQKKAPLLEKSQNIYIGLNTVRQSAIEGKENKSVTVVNFAEAKAIYYWQDHPCTTSEKIVLIGSGEQTVQMLYWGLLTNVFAVNNGINYYTIGDNHQYFELHPDLVYRIKEYGNDNIFVLEGDWSSNIDILKQADRVILCGNSNKNIEIAVQIIDSIPEIKLHICTDSKNAASLINNKRCEFFGAMSKETIEDFVLKDGIYRSAKLCDATYKEYEECLDPDVTNNVDGDQILKEIETEKFIKKWNQRSAYYKGTNIACAVHDDQKIRLLEANGIDVAKLSFTDNVSAFEALEPTFQESLKEIEHIRWSRYHWLNNWKTADINAVFVDSDGNIKNRDEEKRLHKCLVHYNDLPEDEKKKDAIFYYTLPLRLNFKEKDI